MDERGKKRREEILRRMNADDELLGRPAARRESGEEGRERELRNEVEKEREINRGWGLSNLGGP